MKCLENSCCLEQSILSLAKSRCHEATSKKTSVSKNCIKQNKLVLGFLMLQKSFLEASSF